jgi:hypothetical protein
VNRRKIFLIESIFILLVGLLLTQQMSIVYILRPIRSGHAEDVEGRVSV